MARVSVPVLSIAFRSGHVILGIAHIGWEGFQELSREFMVVRERQKLKPSEIVGALTNLIILRDLHA